MTPRDGEQASALVVAALRRALAPLGFAAMEAATSPRCVVRVAVYVAAVHGLSDAFVRFSDNLSDDAALDIQNAAAAYRVALRGVVEQAQAIALESVGGGIPQ